MKKQLGLIGLGVMGKSLSRNFSRNGIKLALYNRFVAGEEEKVAEKFIAQFPELKGASGHEGLTSFVGDLQSPRKIFLMVPAGDATDKMIDSLLPLLSAGDVIIDGGNAHYQQTERRSKKLTAQGINFIGTGVSGGEEGALKGPSIMPGGNPEVYDLVKEELEAIAAKDKHNNACCTHVGKGASGHFVKMVHNGIEYAEMQLIAELYGIMRNSWNYSCDQIASVFEIWLKSDVSGYLLEITADILRKKEDNKPVIDFILDKAGNKGTGSWTTIAACELGVPVPTLTAALFARYQSAFKNDRVNASILYDEQITSLAPNPEKLWKAYKTARIINHHQGLHLIATGSDTYHWEVNLSEVSRIWTNGCILRSELMETMAHWLTESSNLLLHPVVIKEVTEGLPALREVVSEISGIGVAIPCFGSALTYMEIFSRSQSTANIIQAMRDYFGAHRFQRTDDPYGPSHHINWTA